MVYTQSRLVQILPYDWHIFDVGRVHTECQAVPSAPLLVHELDWLVHVVNITLK
jgi:hypothetical protein